MKAINKHRPFKTHLRPCLGCLTVVWASPSANKTWQKSITYLQQKPKLYSNSCRICQSTYPRQCPTSTQTTEGLILARCQPRLHQCCHLLRSSQTLHEQTHPLNLDTRG